MVLVEVRKCELGPVRLGLVAHNRAGGADLARAAIVDDAVLAALLAPSLDGQSNRFLCRRGLAQDQRRDERPKQKFQTLTSEREQGGCFR